MTKTQLKRINRIVTQFTEDNHNVTVSQLYAGDRQFLEEHGLKVTPVKISIYIASISGKKLKEMGNDSNKLIQRICKARKSKPIKKSIFCPYSAENVEILKKYYLNYHFIKYMITK